MEGFTSPLVPASFMQDVVTGIICAVASTLQRFRCATDQAWTACRCAGAIVSNLTEPGAMQSLTLLGAPSKRLVVLQSQCGHVRELWSSGSRNWTDRAGEGG